MIGINNFIKMTLLLKYRCFILLFLSLSFVSQSYAQTDAWQPWEPLYSDSYIQVEIQFKIPSGVNCMGGKPIKYRYRVLGQYRTSTYYLSWKMNYVDCNGDLYYRWNSVEIGKLTPDDISSWQLLESMDYQFTAKTLENKHYDARTSTSPQTGVGVLTPQYSKDPDQDDTPEKKSVAARNGNLEESPGMLTDPLVGTFVLVKGGTFTMGCQNGRDNYCGTDEKPSHQVTLGTFYLAQTEVTQAQWRAVMGNNPSNFTNCDACPVEQVSWEDIQVFLTKLNNRSGGARYRLPTESEWEYAARGGQSSRGYTYAGGNNIDNMAWYGSNSSNKPHPVKGKSANELGLYDMSGNVWEWCSDWYGDYPPSAKVDPRGPASGSYRVLRGGGCGSSVGNCRVSDRDGRTPGSRGPGYGFRLCSSPQ